MISPMYLAMVVLLVIYTKTDALQPKEDEPHRCFQCSEAWCGRGKGTLLSAVCPPERPHCATLASSPNFTSSLTCAEAGERPCSLIYTSNTYEMSCTCQGHLCNAPFSKDLQTDLNVFASVNIPINNSDYSELFWKQSRFENATDNIVYEKIIETSESVSVPTRGTTTGTPKLSTSFIVPRAEALMQETTVPSDDDEDEGEGSGLDEESRTPSRPAAAPAAPSSHLPADDNAAPQLIINLLVFILTIYTII